MGPSAKNDVLVVDDDPSICDLLSAALQRTGLTCDVVNDGIEALERFKGTRYSVVLTDLMMPRLDGIGFVKELAAIDRISSEKPIVLIMTALPDVDRLPAVGEIVQAVIRKPFDTAEIAALVKGCVDARKSIGGRSRPLLSTAAAVRPSLR